MTTALRRLRLITFDVTNTLLQFRSSPGKHYGEIGALFGVRCDNNELAKNYKANWRRMNQSHPNFGRDAHMDWNDWWRQLIAGTFADSGARIPAEKLHNFTNHLLDLYKSSTCWQHCNGSLDLLNYLRQQSDQPLVLGVVANFDPRLDTLLRNLKINNYFDFALNSYDCSAEKPSSAIFAKAAQASGLSSLSPDECLHIGDGPTTDYLAAKAVGWHAALVHEKSAKYLIEKYGDKVDARHVFPSLYDFHKKLAQNVTN